MKYHRMKNIRSPEDLGIALLGSPFNSIIPVSPKNRINCADYGQKLAAAEGGIFTPFGYIVPIKGARRKTDAA